MNNYQFFYLSITVVIASFVLSFYILINVDDQRLHYECEYTGIPVNLNTSISVIQSNIYIDLFKFLLHIFLEYMKKS